MTGWKGTPGPWETNVARLSDGSINVAHIVAHDRASVAQVSVYGEGETVFNAHGIAALPQLVEAALLFVEYDSKDPLDGVGMMLAYNRALEATKAALRAARALP